MIVKMFLLLWFTLQRSAVDAVSVCRQLSKILRILMPGWFTAEVCIARLERSKSVYIL